VRGARESYEDFDEKKLGNWRNLEERLGVKSRRI
jgi:hypothetical protein